MPSPESKEGTVPGYMEAAVFSAAKIIAARLRERQDQITEGRIGDRQTKSPNQIAEEVIEAAEPAIRRDEREKTAALLRFIEAENRLTPESYLRITAALKATKEESDDAPA
jgi:hypothetical protein